jgi:hypothetical protein
VNKEEALETLLGALEVQMKFTLENARDHPGLGYGKLYDKYGEAKKYLQEHLK